MGQRDRLGSSRAPGILGAVYVTNFSRWQDRDQIVAMVRQVGVAQLVNTDAAARLRATLLPIVWDGGDRLIAHASRHNEQFENLDDQTQALAIITGPDAYVDPGWYPSTQASGLAVPTWDYLAVHLSGRLVVHDDRAWIRDAVHQLTAHQADLAPTGWTLSQAPERYLDGMLRGIVGVELLIDEVEAKAKLSSNRTRADREAIVTGLRSKGGGGDVGVADEIDARLDRQEGPVAHAEPDTPV